MTEIPIYQVDAFASQQFRGNPAAVCPLAEWLPDGLMQSIAAENNLSETAFLVRRPDDSGDDGGNGGNGYDLRWFTPTAEVDLCGHATLASAYVLATYVTPEEREFRFHTRSGELIVRRDGDDFTMDFPALAREPVEDVREIAAITDALGVRPLEVWRETDYLAVLPDEATVRGLTPDLPAVAALGVRGVIVTAAGSTGSDYDFVSRFFAPAVGIPEDPVTGSAHCLLTPYWAERLGKRRLSARQLSARGGELACELRGDRVLISGRVAPYLVGHIQV